MPRFVSLFLALALAMLALPALAAPKKPVHVLIIQTEDAVEQAQALTTALKGAVSRVRGYKLADGDYSLEVMALALGCDDPPDPQCLTRIGVKINSTSFVWGTMVRDGKKVVATLHLWQRGSSMTDIRVRYSAALSDPDDDALRELAARALLELTKEERVEDEEAEQERPTSGPAASEPEPRQSDGWQEAKGTLLISAGNVDGEVVVDGRPAGSIEGGRAELELPAGEHYVVVRARGYREAVGTVTVNTRKRARLTLYPEERGNVRNALESWSEEDDGDNSGAGWGAIGVGGLMMAAGVYSTVKVRSINDSPELAGYRSAFRSSQNVCSEAERGTVVQGQASPGEISDLCSEARTFEALQYVFFGLGAVAAGTGVLILLTDDSDQKEDAKRAARLRVVPELSPRRSSLNLHMRF